ncbi:MAG: alpha-L-fucosidase [Ilumatobacteraceae bacterium]|nr:alpha-L-fucosidase [Ilumatobacteraceae bacterium]
MEEFIGTFDSVRQRPHSQWFDDAKFGIFIHWYPSSVPAFAPLAEDLFVQTQKYGEKTAFAESPYAEWYVNSLAIEGSSVQKHHDQVYGDKPYDDFVTEFFNSTAQWQSHEWASTLRQTRAKYIVMGTKHIDGALMWPSRIENPYKGRAYTSSRDLVGEATAAARSVGMRIGLYYCGGLDLTFQGLGFNGWLSMLMATPQSSQYKDYATAHYRELIERYSPDLLWNDVGWPGGGDGAAQLIADFYNARPEGIVNDRFDMIGVAQGTAHSDFITPEYSSGLTVPGKKFEVCRGIGTSFGYNQLEDDSTYATSEELIHLLINTVADGGNLLLNIGPMPNGDIPTLQQQRLTDIGNWLTTNGDAIFGSRPHHTPTLRTDDGLVVRCTMGVDQCAYAIVLGQPSSAVITIEELPRGNVHVLGYALELERNGASITLPAHMMHASFPVLRVE